MRRPAKRMFSPAAAFRRLIATALAAVLAATWMPAAAGENAGERLEIIRRVISERGEYDLAERQLLTFIDEQRGRPAGAEALVLLGYCQDKLRKNREAAATYSRVMAEYPDAPPALRSDASLGAGDAYFRLGRYSEAIENYTTVVDSTERPEQGEAALIWRGEGNYRLGLEAEDASGDNNGDATAFFAAAAADFKEFLERYPESKLLPSALSGAAFAGFDGGDYQEALHYFQRFGREFAGDRRAEECAYYAAESLYRMGRHDEAKAAFQKVIDGNPGGPFAADARAGSAWADYGLGRPAEAAAGFEEAAKLAEGDRDRALSFLYDAGCAWREAGDAQKAAQPFLEVAKVPDHELNALAWFRLGTLWQEQARAARERAETAVNADEKRKYREMQKKLGADSVQYFRRALAGDRLGAEEIEARSLLGEVLLDAGEYAEAAAAFAEIADMWPDSDRAPWAFYHQALAERELSLAAGADAAKQGHLRAAAAALRKSLERPEAKTRLQAAWALADYLTELNDKDAAREQYRWLASDGEAWAKAWRGADGREDGALAGRARDYAADALFRLGESYYFDADYTRASGFYLEIGNKFSDMPQSAMAMLRRGEIAEHNKNSTTARERYEECLRLALRFGKNRVGSTIGYAQLRLGTVLLREGQKEPDGEARRRMLQEAQRNLAAVIADPPAGVELDRAYYYLGEAKYSLGMPGEAKADYENSLKTKADGELADAAWFGLAWVARDLGETAEAEAAARRVVESFPGSGVRPDALTLLASILRGNGDAAGALAVLDRFILEYPGHALTAKAELERASALNEAGRSADAAAAFQKFLADHPEHQDAPQALYQRSLALRERLAPQIAEAREAEARWRDLSGGRAVDDLPVADRPAAAAAEEEWKSRTAEIRKVEDEILSSLRDLGERYPDYRMLDAVWLRAGEILYDRADYQQAMAAYRSALNFASAQDSALADKALYRLAWSIQRLAEEDEKESVSSAVPERRETARKDMWEKRVAAIDTFESLLGHYPESELIGDACFRAAELRRRSGMDNTDPAKRTAWFESAIQRYNQALERGGPDAPYRQAAEYGGGFCLLLDDKSEEAREVFRRLLLNQDGPYVQEAYWGLGQANLNLGAYADAASAFEQALAIDKTTETAAKARYGLGITAAQAGDSEKARLEFLAVDSLYANYPDWAAAALVRAARTALAGGQRDKAIGDIERVLARYGETQSADEARELQAEITAGR